MSTKVRSDVSFDAWLSFFASHACEARSSLGGPPLSPAWMIAATSTAGAELGASRAEAGYFFARATSVKRKPGSVYWSMTSPHGPSMTLYGTVPVAGVPGVAPFT